MFELDDARVFGTEGSGDQKKCWMNGVLIKLNSKWHESEKEYSACKIGQFLGFPVVDYRKGQYIYQGKKYKGCECDSFLQDNEECITLYTILEFVKIPMNMSAVDYFNITVSCVERYTDGYLTRVHIENYLKCLVLFDYIICNSDRHLSNIEFIKGQGYWRFAPYFDNGQAFLKRDGISTKKQLDLELRKFKTLPFSTNPERNLIDLKFAVNFCKNIDIQKLSLLDINSYHKKLAIQRIKYLQNIKI